jgi:hypothetical protein
MIPEIEGGGYPLTEHQAHFGNALTRIYFPKKFRAERCSRAAPQWLKPLFCCDDELARAERVPFPGSRLEARSCRDECARPYTSKARPLIPNP